MTATRSDLVAHLSQGGFLIDPAWRDAFRAVPREVFVPWFFASSADRPGWQIVEDGPRCHDAVYSDKVLVTQIDGDDRAVTAARRGETVRGTPTSSSSAPSLMAAMLHALDVRDGATVLEIGTGTGYNATLLAHRLGDTHVTSMDIDAGLVERARAAVAAAGHHPALVVGDGTAGYPPHGPYDRIIATVAFPHVPSALLNQVPGDGLILLPLAFAGQGGLMVLLRPTREGATGRFLSQYGGFMPIRGSGEQPELARLDADLWMAARPTEVPSDTVRDRHPASFFLSLSCPIPYGTLGFHATGDDTEQTWGYGTDGSLFALKESNGHPVVAADGPLWQVLETAYRRWLDLGEPSRDRFGLTVAGDRQWVWLDSPDQVIVDHLELVR